MESHATMGAMKRANLSLGRGHAQWSTHLKLRWRQAGDGPSPHQLDDTTLLLDLLQVYHVRAGGQDPL